MIATLRTLRIIFAAVGIWQAIGIIPVVTWVTNPRAITLGMVGGVIFKAILAIICAGAFVWLGKIKRKHPSKQERMSDVAIACIALAALVAATIVVAIVIPDGNSSKPARQSVASVPRASGTSQVATGSFVGEWRCINTSPTTAYRLILHPDGSVSSNDGLDILFHDPWMRWYPAARSDATKPVALLRISAQGPNKIVVQYPSNKLSTCAR